MHYMARRMDGKRAQILFLPREWERKKIETNCLDNYMTSTKDSHCGEGGSNVAKTFQIS